MIIFPELVFSRAVVDLMTAYSDYQQMWKQKEQLHQLGWCMHRNRGLVWIALLLARRPVWPWNLARATQVNSDVELEHIDVPPSGNEHEDPTMPFYDRNNLEILRDVTRRDCKEHDSCIWTLTHSTYVNMGGLVVKFNEKEGYLCRASDLRSHGAGGDRILANNHFTRAEILDKSKGDTFVRLLWLLQIFRLVLDLSRRRYKKYPISPFEIITLSFAALSFATVVLQIKKPLDVRTPIYLEDSRDPNGHRRFRNDSEEWMSLIHFFFTGIHKSDVGQMKRRANDAYRVDALQEIVLFSMLVVSTIAFGLIHCAAWNYAFPSAVETYMWRSAALYGIGMPILALTYTAHLIGLRRQSWVSTQQTYVRARTVNTSQVLSLILHLSSRIALIVIALISFRSAPQGIYLDTWAAFIPTLQ